MLVAKKSNESLSVHKNDLWHNVNLQPIMGNNYIPLITKFNSHSSLGNSSMSKQICSHALRSVTTQEAVS